MSWYEFLTEKEALEIMYKSLKIGERLETDLPVVNKTESNEELHREKILEKDQE